jgi:magnesium chelatase subunit D
VLDGERKPDKPHIEDAILAGAVFAADPALLGGIIVRANAGPVREAWLAYVMSLLPQGMPIRRMPSHITDERLLGGLDLAATLNAGRPVAACGLLKESDRGVIIIPSAERLPAPLASRIAAAIDAKAVTLQRDGFEQISPARFGIIGFDEGASPDESPPSALLDRAALHATLHGAPWPLVTSDIFDRKAVGSAAKISKNVQISDEALNQICEMAVLLGVSSSNASLQAVRTCRLLAALAGREYVSEDDITVSIRLTIAPKATRYPDLHMEPANEEPEDTPREPKDSPIDSEQSGQSLERLIEAVKATLPSRLLEQLHSAGLRKTHRASAGKSGASHRSPSRGRPAGTKSGRLSRRDRLNIVETLRAAAPWQKLRQSKLGENSNRIAVRSTDFRICKLKARSETVTIFVVDASGSTAVQRLAEAKGAVEILLSECYSRRDHAAMIAFNGRGSELLLPPTRSVTRAKRNLTDLLGGGGTPLASAITAATELCDTVRRRGQTPSVVLLTDGRANIDRHGKPGRRQAEADAFAAAQKLRDTDTASLVIDTSARPNAQAARLSDAMGAVYLPLAHADAEVLSNAVRSHDNWSFAR